ncbi:hypothetical protein [Jeongeupia naejangsanensis]|uniref:Flagellar hook-length control protein FliK n=1 Tax=Jeongeupia naejangsanensis TaxID=613195 RepID=A0ABS2BGJ7_9NEIS|nr:hypothetical protein [Jeongeupia naejangsanensis]MBM3114731.1 hypothetical protein [Jeongeupia naejangsanensis]
MTPALNPLSAPVAAPSTGTATLPQGAALAVGSLLQVTIVTGREGDRHLTGLTDAGQRLALPQLAGRTVVPGDVLLLRVLATMPQLQLAVVDETPAGASASVLPSSYAMQSVDQLALRRVGWAAPDLMAVAAGWRLLMQTRMATDVDPKLLPGGAPLPGWLLQADVGATLQRSPEASETRWLYPAFAWGGLPLTLGLLEPDDSAPAPDDDDAEPVLLLTVQLPAIGLVALAVIPAGVGVRLQIRVASATAGDLLRALQPALAAATLRAGCTLVECRIGAGRVGQRGGWRLRRRAVAPGLLAPRLFDVAAQVLQVLTAPQTP